VCGLKFIEAGGSLRRGGHTPRGCVDWNRAAGIGRSDPVVTPHAGVWIEISTANGYTLNTLVTPHAGVWIEISAVYLTCAGQKSHPTRVCGLKLVVGRRPVHDRRHTPRGCVDWNTALLTASLDYAVTPHAGVWIEICSALTWSIPTPSHPTRVCGLKFPCRRREENIYRHTPRGCVDW